ncbi:glycosyltransferase family 2 protein [Desulforhabdus amnigena]|nr:glycosyltransferase [Desulforhabdus amnigena]
MNKASCSTNPEITVLMSCYNAGRWLHEAIDSVLQQTFKNFEFIILDDGSEDETWNIIQSYCSRDKRIVAIRKENTGLADSLNVGIAHAKGTWIARLDADDLCEPTRLEEQIAFIRKNPEIVLLGTGFLEINDSGSVLKRHSYPAKHDQLLHRLKRSMAFFPHSSAFYRTDLVQRVHGYNPRIKRSEDTDLWLRLSEKGKLGCFKKPLVRIRKHSEQISLDQAGKRQLCDSTAARVCYFLRSSGIPDPSASNEEADWSSFLEWVENRIDQESVCEKRKAWNAARSEFLQAKNRLTGIIRFSNRLLHSSHTRELLSEKFFGSSLPQRLASEWVKHYIEEHS